jgi:hypothetical protein
MLESNCQSTLKQMCDSLRVNFGVNVSTTAIAKKLEDLMFTLKTIHVEPCGMNSEKTELRATFVEKVMTEMGEGRQVFGRFQNSNLQLHI